MRKDIRLSNPAGCTAKYSYSKKPQDLSGFSSSLESPRWVCGQTAALVVTVVGRHSFRSPANPKLGLQMRRFELCTSMIPKLLMHQGLHAEAVFSLPAGSRSDAWAVSWATCGSREWERALFSSSGELSSLADALQAALLGLSPSEDFKTGRGGTQMLHWAAAWAVLHPKGWEGAWSETGICSSLTQSFVFSMCCGVESLAFLFPAFLSEWHFLLVLELKKQQILHPLSSRVLLMFFETRQVVWPSNCNDPVPSEMRKTCHFGL